MMSGRLYPGLPLVSPLLLLSENEQGINNCNLFKTDPFETADLKILRLVSGLALTVSL